MSGVPKTLGEAPDETRRDVIEVTERERDKARAERDQACAERDQACAERDQAYRERAHLVAYLAAAHPSEIVEQPGKFADEWPVIYELERRGVHVSHSPDCAHCGEAGAGVAIEQHRSHVVVRQGADGEVVAVLAAALGPIVSYSSVEAWEAATT